MTGCATMRGQAELRSDAERQHDIRVVVSRLVNRYGGCIDPDALFSAANYGVFMAEQSYDSTRGTSLKTYARRIGFLRAIDALRDEHESVRQRRVNRPPDTLSLEHVLAGGNGEGPLVLGDVLSAESDPQRSVDFEDSLRLLPEREREMVRLRVEGWTLLDIAKRYHLCKSWVWKIFHWQLRTTPFARELQA